jgi:hypothetical protein
MSTTGDSGQEKGISSLKESYPKLQIDALVQKLKDLGLGDLLKNPLVELGLLVRYCEWTAKVINAAQYRQLCTEAKAPLSPRDLVVHVLSGHEEEVGVRALDVPRVSLEGCLFQPEWLQFVDYLRQQGVSIPAEVVDIPSWEAWARSFETIKEGVPASPNTGLYERPFMTATGDLRGLQTRSPDVQAEIDGVNAGINRAFLRLSRQLVTEGVATLLNQDPVQPLDFQRVTSPRFGQTA